MELKTKNKGCSTSKSEQLALFNTMKQVLFPDEPDKITKLLKCICEVQFASGLGCVPCGSKSVKLNGKYRSRQCYLCSDCGKSFNDITNTPFSGSRYPEKWLKYIELIVEGYTYSKLLNALKYTFPPHFIGDIKS